jgi:hypothetical protein
MTTSQAVWPTSKSKVVVRNRPRLTSASSPLTSCFSASIIPPSPPHWAPRSSPELLPSFLHDGWNGFGVNRLKPGAYQHQVGRAGCEQRDGQPEIQAFAGGLADRAHGQKHRAILARESQAIFLPGFRTRLRLRDSHPRGRGRFWCQHMSFPPRGHETGTRPAR